MPKNELEITITYKGKIIRKIGATKIVVDECGKDFMIKHFLEHLLEEKK